MSDNLFQTLVTVVLGTIGGTVRAISSGISSVQDFFLVRISGLSFIVLGARQTGKTTLIEWLKNNMELLDEFQPDPTAAGGDAVEDFTAKIGSNTMKLKPVRDVGGEYAMWETDWIELFREAQPRGIIFVLDHGDVHLQKDALNFTLQMIEDEPTASKNLRAFYVLVNKSDLWEGETSLEQIMYHYRNEKRRLVSQSERMGYKWQIADGSLKTGRGVYDLMKSFFNALRPRSVASSSR